MALLLRRKASARRWWAFLELLGLVALWAVPWSSSSAPLPDIFSYRAKDVATLRQGFAQPPREAGPWVYWFWWNSVVSREEIARELEEMAAAGMAGAELRVVTCHGWGGEPLAGMDSANLDRLGHRQLRYLSDEWVDTLAFTCATAERLGLRLAINLGQGWPPGGPWITEPHRSKHLVWESQEVEGPSVIVRTNLPTDGWALAWRLSKPGGSKTVEAGSFQDLTRFVERPASGGVLRWEVPEGRWLIGLFSVNPGGICDKGDGPEVDPASREAVLFHLNFMFHRLDPKLRRYYGTTLIDVASDSWEYERPPGGGRYWSPAILDAFPKGAGYDLRGRMHALLGYGPAAAQVLHDLESVERQLIHSNFFGSVTGFLNERGLRHRPQAYGRGLARDLLFSYTLSDTPEIEPTLVLPEAPWAAHTTGKPVVSAEAFTFLGLYQNEGKSPVRNLPGPWEATPAALRLSANHYYGEGINRIQMHSFGYSPPGLPLPGWRMYAEIHLNRNVPWWPFIRPLTTWMACQQWLLQAGWPVADALVYPVTSNPDDGPFFKQGESQPISAGNAVDAANDQTLPAVLRACAAGRYAVSNLCLLDEVKTLEEARRVLQFLDAGARLLACKSLPSDWAGLREASAESVRQRYAQAQTEGRLVDARADGWRIALDKVRSVQWTPDTAKLVFQHRRVRDGEIYFLVNYGEPFSGPVSFPHSGQRPETWDPDTGRASPVGCYTEHNGRIHIPVTLAHFESAFVVFSQLPTLVHVTKADRGTFQSDAEGGLYVELDQPGESRFELSDGKLRTFAVRLPPPLTVPGPWQLSVSAAQAVSPQAPLSLRLDRLVSWRTLPDLRHYAGSASYTTELVVPPGCLASNVAWHLDLGEVFEVARVTINDRDAGTVWRRPFRVDVTGLLQAGRNSLRIEVPNLLKNHLEKSDSYERPSGLLGPVVLRPSSRIPVGPSTVGAGADPTRLGLIGPWYGNADFTRAKGSDLLRTMAPEFDSETGFGSSWSAMWEGELVAPASTNITFRVKTNGRISLKIGGARILETRDGLATGTMEMVQDGAYPIQVYYSHQSEGKGAFSVEWSWRGHELELIPEDRIRHTIAQEAYWNYRPEPDRAMVDRSALRKVTGKHVVVYGEPGRFAGWPANNGLWSWGNEILVGFSLGYHKSDAGGGHAINPARPQVTAFARSVDGGESWQLEQPAMPTDRTSQGNALKLPIDFAHPNFAMRCSGDKFIISHDRGRSWEGPYSFPRFPTGRLTSRTDYLISGPDTCTVFLSAEEKGVQVDEYSDRAFCARTTDGGLSWHFLGWMTGEPIGVRSVMPATVRISEAHLVSALRRRIDRGLGGDRPPVTENWIDAHESRDNGITWHLLSNVAETDRGKRNGNPPALVKLRDGRLVAAHGYRGIPYGIQARISTDQGTTWGEPIHLRDDAATWDMGYCRMVERPDGRLVTIYYYNTPERAEQHIAATIWDPNEVPR